MLNDGDTVLLLARESQLSHLVWDATDFGTEWHGALGYFMICMPALQCRLPKMKAIV